MLTGYAASHTMTRTASWPTFERVTAIIAGAQRGWWFEDAIPGELMRHPGGRTIGDAEHVWLAWVTHNVSDIHGNADSASRTEWGQPLVLGMLSAAIVIGLAAPVMGPAEMSDPGLGAGWQSIKLEGAVRAGDTLRAESIIEAIGPAQAAAFGNVERNIVGRNQDDDVVVRIHERRDIPRRIS